MQTETDCRREAQSETEQHDSDAEYQDGTEFERGAVAHEPRPDVADHHAGEYSDHDAAKWGLRGAEQCNPGVVREPGAEVGTGNDRQRCGQP